MSPETQRVAIAESCEWVQDGPHGNRWIAPDGHRHEIWGEGLACPNYPNDRNAIHAALLHHGIQSHDNPALRVKFVGHLREIAARRLPRNTVGTSLMSDVDLVTCEASELCEALLKTLKRWKP